MTLTPSHPQGEGLPYIKYFFFTLYFVKVALVFDSEAQDQLDEIQI